MRRKLGYSPSGPHRARMTVTPARNSLPGKYSTGSMPLVATCMSRSRLIPSARAGRSLPREDCSIETPAAAARAAGTASILTSSPNANTAPARGRRSILDQEPLARGMARMKATRGAIPGRGFPYQRRSHTL